MIARRAANKPTIAARPKHECLPWIDCGHGEPFPPARPVKPQRTTDLPLCDRCNGGGITYYGRTCLCSGGYRR